MRFSIVERQFVVQRFYEVFKDRRQTQIEFEIKFAKTAPSIEAIRQMVIKFENRGTLLDQNKGRSGRPVTVTTVANTEIIQTFIANNPRTSIKAAAQNSNISAKSTHRILRKKLNMKPFKIRNVQLLSVPAKIKRLDCARIFLDLLNDEEQPEVLQDVWFTDEAHFYLNGHSNKQNQRIWSCENPHQLNESPLFPKRVTIWAGMSSKGIHFQVLHENVTSISYMDLLRTWFIPYLQESGEIDNAFFMQDGARPHTANMVLAYLCEVFDERVISNRYPEVFQKGFSWPPYSPDLNPCDYFLWGYLKDRVYVNNPQTLAELETAIALQIYSIPRQMLQNTINAFPKRLQMVIEKNGGHVEPYL